MRLLAFTPLAAAIAFLCAGQAASAQVVVRSEGEQTYAGITLRNPETDRGTINAVASGPTPRAIYEHAFYTPLPNYQQAGYQCAGIVAVTFRGRTRQLHRGTYCVR